MTIDTRVHGWIPLALMEESLLFFWHGTGVRSMKDDLVLGRCCSPQKLRTYSSRVEDDCDLECCCSHNRD